MKSQNGPKRTVDSRVTTTLSQVAEMFGEQQAQYALIGGLGVALRGNVRATEDVDILLHVEQVQLPNLLRAMRDRGCVLNVRDSIREWNENGMLAVQWPGQVQVDLLKAVIPLFHQIIQRAKEETLDEQAVIVADAEGLLVLKLIAFRPLDQEDIRGMLTKNAGVLDLTWVRQQAVGVGLDRRRLDEFEMLVRDFYVTDS